MILQEQRVAPNNSLLSSVAATLRVGTWRVTNELLRMATTRQANLGHSRWLRNPAPVDRWFIPRFSGFQPTRVVPHFFHIFSYTVPM